MLSVWGTFFITNVFYFSVGGVYSYLDLTNTPTFLRKYKIQPGENEPVEPAKFWSMFRQVVFNQTVVYLALLHLLYYLFQLRGMAELKVLPEFHTVLLHLAVCTIAEEVGFFYTHWIMHSKYVSGALYLL